MVTSITCISAASITAAKTHPGRNLKPGDEALPNVVSKGRTHFCRNQDKWQQTLATKISSRRRERTDLARLAPRSIQAKTSQGTCQKCRHFPLMFCINRHNDTHARPKWRIASVVEQDQTDRNSLYDLYPVTGCILRRQNGEL